MSANAMNRHSSGARQAAQSGANQVLRSGQELAPIQRPARLDNRLMMAHHPSDPRCDKIRALRTELLLRRDSIDRANVVVLLSPCVGEGRSLLAAELAIAFAQTGFPTLLVDADMHRPQQHIIFGTHNRQGLAQALEHDAEAELHVVQGLPQLSVMTAGVVTTHPLELLSSRRFAAMVGDWRANFEFVVIDTAPVGLFSDGLAIANLAGQVLTLSRAKHTPFLEMQDMLQRIAATRSRVLGAVISHF